MSRFFVGAAFGFALPLALASAPAAAQYGDVAACRSGGGPTGSAILVNINGFRERRGNVRVNVYGSNPSALPRPRPICPPDQRAGDRQRPDAGLRRGAAARVAMRSRSATIRTATAVRAGATAAAFRAIPASAC